MTLWQNLQSLIHPLLLALYPELNDETQPESSREQGQQLRYQLLQQLFTDLNEHNESEQTEAFVQACLLNDISYTPIYSDLMALARSVLGSLVNGQNCQEVMALNQSFDRIEKQVSQAYFQQYLRKLAVKNHIRLSHLANLSEKNLLVHYQNHLKENSRLDLIYFLSSHYSAHGDGISSDDKEEKEMPFMQNNQRSINISLVNLSDLSIIPPSVNYIHTKYTIFQQFYISDIHTLSLLRPPIRLS